MHLKRYSLREKLLIIFAIFFLTFLAYCMIAAKHAHERRGVAASKAGLDVQVRSGSLCNDNRCEPALLLSGYMQEGFSDGLIKAAKEFEQVKWICLDSPGGDPSQGIALAKMLQSVGKSTCVVPIGKPSELQHKTVCASACVFAFAGGDRRILVNDDRSLGIHRSYVGTGIECIPCNLLVAPMLHLAYAAITEIMLNRPNFVLDLLWKSFFYPGAFDSDPTKVHWVDKQEFIHWGLGEIHDIDAGWHFIESIH